MNVKFDKISQWSEIKLDIINQYAVSYMDIMKQHKFKTHYIDGFSGAGIHCGKNSGDVVAGSPLRVLDIQKSFDTYKFVDLNGDKADYLREICRKQFPSRNATTVTGDCNDVLMQILPKFSWENYDRLFCLLDPYGLHLNWEVIARMGAMGIVDLILHFPIMDINRNAIWKDPSKVPQDGIDRMNAFWGDSSWREVAYEESKQRSMFDDSPKEKRSNKNISHAFKRRLQEHGKFQFVPEPMPLKNSKNAVIYYLFFASQNETANKIATYLFEKYNAET